MMRTTKYGTYTFLRSDFDLKYGIIDLAEKDFRYSCGDVMSKRWDVFDSEEADKFTQKIAQMERTNQEFEIKNVVYNNLTDEFLEFEVVGKSGKYCDIYFKDNRKKCILNSQALQHILDLPIFSKYWMNAINHITIMKKSFKIIDRAYNYETLDEEEQEIFDIFRKVLMEV